MYTHFSIPDFATGAEKAIKAPVRRYGVSVFVDTDADWVAPDFVIDAFDEEGMKIFREFAGRMAAHYKTLLK